MYPYSRLPKPLPHATFYILLVLSRAELHGYAIIGAIENSSLGSVAPPAGRLYPLLKSLTKAEFIEEAGLQPAGKSSQQRLHYRITKKGLKQLKTELKRLKHAVEIGQAAGHFSAEMPKDLRDLIDSLR